MMDAYAHLDTSVADPLTDLRLRMASASVNRALIVETWGKDNTAILERLSEVPQSEFRIALCYRPDEGFPSPDLFERNSVVALRVKTSDLSRLNETAGLLDASGKWLLPHAESGIRALTNELMPLLRQWPDLRVYLPHLGWPRREQHNDPQWRESIAELSRLPNVVAGISAIAHFSSEVFPHADIEPFAACLIQAFGLRSIVIGSDYPLFEKEQYGRYLELAQRWAFGANHQATSELESAFFAPFPA